MEKIIESNINKKISLSDWMNPLKWTFSTWFLMGMFCFVFAVTAFGTLVPAMQEILQFKLHLVFFSFLATVVVPALLSVWLHAYLVKRFGVNVFYRIFFLCFSLGCAYGLAALMNVATGYDTLVGRSLLVLDCVSRFDAPRCQERMDSGERHYELLLPEAQEIILHNMSSVHTVPNTTVPDDTAESSDVDAPLENVPEESNPSP